MNRAADASQQGLPADSSEVQSIVDEWIQVFANALSLPIDATFMERFAGYAESLDRNPNRRLWDIMVRLNPEKLKPELRAQELMLSGLRWRLKQD